MKCTCNLGIVTDSLAHPAPDTFQFELKLLKCPLCEAAPELLKVAEATSHLCIALLACREGVGEALLVEIRDAAQAAIRKSGRLKHAGEKE